MLTYSAVSGPASGPGGNEGEALSVGGGVAVTTGVGVGEIGVAVGAGDAGASVTPKAVSAIEVK